MPLSNSVTAFCSFIFAKLVSCYKKILFQTQRGCLLQHQLVYNTSFWQHILKWLEVWYSRHPNGCIPLSPCKSAITTRVGYNLGDFVAQAFACLGLDLWEHTASDGSLYRPTKIAVGRRNLSKAMVKLGSKAKYKMRDVVRLMVEGRRVK